MPQRQPFKIIKAMLRVTPLLHFMSSDYRAEGNGGRENGAKESEWGIAKEREDKKKQGENEIVINC